MRRIVAIAALTALMLFGLYFGCSAWLISRAEAATPRFMQLFYNITCPEDSLPNLVADRFEATVEGPAQLVTRNSAIKILRYNSATDNYVPGEEHTRWVTTAGADSEIIYLHWSETTVVKRLSSDSASKTMQAGERVPVYMTAAAATPRSLVSFHSSTGRDLMKQFAIDEMAANHLSGRAYDGWFSDNSAWNLDHLPYIVSGGHISECSYVVGVTNFQQWYRNGREQFFSDLTAATSKIITRNVALWTSLYWNDSLATRPSADWLWTEYGGSLIYHVSIGTTGPATWFNRAKLCDQNGKRLVFSPHPQVPTDGDSLRTVYGNICYYFGVRYGDTMTGLVQQNSPCGRADAGADCAGCPSAPKCSPPAGFGYSSGNCASAPTGTAAWQWPRKVYRPLVDTLKTYLVNYSADPYVVKEGTGPDGIPYKVYERDFDNGLILMRAIGQLTTSPFTFSNPADSAGTAVQVTGLNHVAKVLINGQKAGNLTSYWIPAGRAVAFLNPGAGTCKPGSTCQELEDPGFMGGGTTDSLGVAPKTQFQHPEIRIYDVRGRRLSARPASGIYIEETWLGNVRTARKVVKIK